MTETLICNRPEDTSALGERLGRSLIGGELILLYGGLGAGKTLLTKGILSGLGYDVDEVTSPSFSLVNLYKTNDFDVYHIDLWRLENSADIETSVGLEEILETPHSITIIEWADRLAKMNYPGPTIKIILEGDGDDPRRIVVERTDNARS